MSKWQALAYVRSVREEDLRDRLVDVVEELYDVEGAIRQDECSFPLLPKYLDSDARSFREERDEAELARDRAEDRLEEKLQEDLKERLAEVEKERDELKERLANLEVQSEAYSDALAMARRFVSVGTKAGTPVKHCREVNVKKRRSS